MTAQESSYPRRGDRRWGRTGETRRVLLEAAREMFTEHGFAETSVACVVKRAGSSVGSLYHHFGGKTELFLALWEEWESSQEYRAAGAVREARQAGETHPMGLFLAGARGFLRGAWEGRRTGTLLFMDKDGPPGFDLMRRTRSREWFRQNSLLLQVGDDAMGRVIVAVLTTIIGAAGREIVTSSSAEEAEQIIEAAVRMIERLDPLEESRES